MKLNMRCGVSSRRGFVLMTMIIFLSAIFIIISSLAFLLKYQSQLGFRALQRSMAKECLYHALDVFTGQLEDYLSDDRAAVIKNEKKEYCVSRGSEWKKVFDGSFSNTFITKFMGKEYTFLTNIQIHPLQSQNMLMINSKDGGLKKNLKELLENEFNNQCKDRYLRESDISWNLIKDFYDSYLKVKYNQGIPSLHAQTLGSQKLFDCFDGVFRERDYRLNGNSPMRDMNCCVISPVIRKVNLQVDLKIEKIQTPRETLYKLDTLQIMPELMIHNPYDVGLELKDALITWDVDLPIRLFSFDGKAGAEILFSVDNADDFWEDNDVGVLNLQQLIASQGRKNAYLNATGKKLVLRLDYLFLKPGECISVVIDGVYSYNGSILNLKRRIGNTLGEIHFKLPAYESKTNYKVNKLQAHQELSVKNEFNENVQELNIYIGKDSDIKPLWEAKNIHLSSGNDQFYKFGKFGDICSRPIHLFSLELNYIINKKDDSIVENNRFGSSLLGSSWKAHVKLGDSDFKKKEKERGGVYLTLPSKKLESIGQFVDMPIMPLDVYPIRILGNSKGGLSNMNKNDSCFKINEVFWDQFCLGVNGDAQQGVVKIIDAFRNDSKTMASEKLFANEYFVKGGFNVNTTNVEEWEAFFIKHNDTLSAGEIKALSRSIVDCIQEYGPFISLDHFVNGNVGVDKSSVNSNDKLGVLQCALVQAGIDGPNGKVLEQALVLKNIIPYLSVRWDSWCFQIEVKQELPKSVVLKAQVILQKIPLEYNMKDEIDVEQQKAPERLVPRRKFVVTAFRWL